MPYLLNIVLKIYTCDSAITPGATIKKGAVTNTPTANIITVMNSMNKVLHHSLIDIMNAMNIICLVSPTHLARSGNKYRTSIA